MQTLIEADDIRDENEKTIHLVRAIGMTQWASHARSV